MGRVREEKKEDQRRERRSEKRKSQVRRQKMQVRKKVAKSRNTVFFPMICGSGGSKSRLAKAAGAEPAGQMRDEKLHAVVARSTFPSQNVQNTPCSVEKVHAVVARSTCRGQNVKNTPCPDNFGRSDAVSRGRSKGLGTLSKSEPNVRVL